MIGKQVYLSSIIGLAITGKFKHQPSAESRCCFDHVLKTEVNILSYSVAAVLFPSLLSASGI